MKNDLKELNMEDSDVMSQYDNTKAKVNVFDKIRNSTYYLISRAIRFGLDTNFLLSKCNLTSSILRDLCLQNEPGSNGFLF